MPRVGWGPRLIAWTALMLAGQVGVWAYGYQARYHQFYEKSQLTQDLLLETTPRPLPEQDFSHVLRKYYPLGVDKKAVIAGLLRSNFKVVAIEACLQDYDVCEAVTLQASVHHDLINTTFHVIAAFSHGKLKSIHGVIWLTGS